MVVVEASGLCQLFHRVKSRFDDFSSFLPADKYDHFHPLQHLLRVLDPKVLQDKPVLSFNSHLIKKRKAEVAVPSAAELEGVDLGVLHSCPKHRLKSSLLLAPLVHVLYSLF